MADRVRKVNYCYMTVPARAGQGANVLGQLKDAGVDLLAFTGFPTKAGKAQIDLIAQDMPAVRRVAKKNDWRLSANKKGFLIQGGDKPGAVPADAVAAGQGRYGMLLWVKQKDYARAARALKAK
jgi:hypothetical protein